MFEVALLDERNERVAVDDAGEIALHPRISKALMNGYHGAPEKTLEVFGDLWYHTGDIGYRDEGENLYFVDRDHFIIRQRGENVSSRHVEEALNEHDTIVRSAVVPVPAAEGGEDEIGASVETADGAELTSGEGRDFLDGRLPDIMVPKYVQVVELLPVTETNKIVKSEVKDRVVEQALAKREFAE